MSNRHVKAPLSLRMSSKPDAAGIAPKALAVAIGVASAGSGWAGGGNQAKTVADESNVIEVIEVYGQPGARYKAVSSADLRRSADLASTPQTMTILTQTQLLDSGKTDLKEILEAQAGITLGTGENGNAFGDRYIIRGHEARSDVFVDGIRDPGMTTRESFATEQIEITKGPSSTFAGRGSTGGAVNGITKQASRDYDFTILEGGLGTDEQHRLTMDSNVAVNDRFAVRTNLLHANEDVPDREPADRERLGGLVSTSYAATERLDLVADFYYLDAEDLPDLGSYFDQTKREPVEDIPVYLQTQSDFLDTEVRTGTLKVGYELSDSLRVHNAARYGRTDNGYVTTGARGAVRHVTDPEAPGAATMTLSGHQGWQEVDYFVDQLNVLWDASLGGLEHKIVVGLEYNDEKVKNGIYSLVNTAPTNCLLPGRVPPGSPPGTVAPAQPGYCALDGTGRPVPNINTLLGREVTRGDVDSDYHIETTSAYLMDTVDFNERWTGFFGVRFDHFDYDNVVVSQGVPTEFEYGDGFWNGHVGIVRHIGKDGNVYVTYSTATNINGGESDVGGSCGYGGLCGTPDQVDRSDPEQTQNYEIGTKWSLFDDRVLATAAVFRMDKTDVMESVGNAYDTLGTLNTGENRVEGVEFSLTGNVSEKLSAQFGAAFMQSEVEESFVEANEGLVLSNFADDSVYLQLRYQPTPTIAFGGAVTYKSKMYGGQPDTAAGYDAVNRRYSVVVPSYEVYDLFFNYYPTDRINVRVNVNNVLDEEYWVAAYRSGSFMYLGDARSVRATLTWEI
jgi:catecholate siderophore receptor